MSDDTSTSQDPPSQDPAGRSDQEATAPGGGRLRNFGLAFIAASAVLVILAFILESNMAA